MIQSPSPSGSRPSTVPTKAQILLVCGAFGRVRLLGRELLDAEHRLVGAVLGGGGKRPGGRGEKLIAQGGHVLLARARRTERGQQTLEARPAI